MLLLPIKCPMTRNAWVSVLCHLSCGYPLSCDAESLACHVGGEECILGRCTGLRCPLPRNESEQAFNGRCQGYLSERCDLLSPDPSLFVCLQLTQALYWATPLQRWWRNASPWGVKVGVRNVAWWAVYHRKRLPLWGGVAVGAWMALGIGPDFCILSEVGFQPQDLET